VSNPRHTRMSHQRRHWKVNERLGDAGTPARTERDASGLWTLEDFRDEKRDPKRHSPKRRLQVGSAALEPNGSGKTAWSGLRDRQASGSPWIVDDEREACAPPY